MKTFTTKDIVEIQSIIGKTHTGWSLGEKAVLASQSSINSEDSFDECLNCGIILSSSDFYAGCINCGCKDRNIDVS